MRDILKGHSNPLLEKNSQYHGKKRIKIIRHITVYRTELRNPRTEHHKRHKTKPL